MLNQALSPQFEALFVGLATVDAEYFVDNLPQPNQKITVSSQDIAAGGPATNAAITFAFLGAKARLVTAIGQHAMAAVIRDDLGHFGVLPIDIASERHEAPPLSSIFVFPKNGERTVISANAAAFPGLRYQTDLNWLQNVSIALVDGYYMSLCETVASAARVQGIRTVLDAGSWKAGMVDLLASTDIAICSSDFWPPGCKSESEVFSYLSQAGVGSIAITRGERPVVYIENGDRGEINVPQVNAVDTLGAGDIFHGAFCYSACQPRHTFRESLQFAAHIASFSCRYPGTRLWMQTFPGVDAIWRYSLGLS